jgi:small-conductance mechanosensitive channel
MKTLILSVSLGLVLGLALRPAFGSSSLDLEVFSYVTVTDYGEYLEIAEDLNLRIMDIVAAADPVLPYRRR